MSIKSKLFSAISSDTKRFGELLGMADDKILNLLENRNSEERNSMLKEFQSTIMRVLKVVHHLP